MIYNPVCFAYYRDPDFVERCKMLLELLERANEAAARSYDYSKAAFLAEMFNHEYGINWQADFDTLSAFGAIRWHGDDAAALLAYFDDLHFSDEQRRAYMDARAEYYRRSADLY